MIQSFQSTCEFVHIVWFHIVDILQSKLVKRNLSLKILDPQKVENALGGNVKQEIKLKKGLSTELAKKITGIIKDTKLKVQGVVVASVVNQTAFYIGDETGVMAVSCSAETDGQFLIRQVIAVPGFQLQTILLIDTLSAHGMKGFLFQFLIFHRVCTSGYRQMPTSRAFLFSSPK